MESLQLVDVGDGRMMHPADRDEFDAFTVPKKARYSLVAGIDGISLLRRDLKSLLQAEDLGREFFGTNLGGVTDLPSHSILDRGRLVGLWEYDTATESIAWAAFVPKDRDMERAVGRTEEFVRTQLGDARAYSLDSPKSRIPRVEALRAAGKA